MKTIDDKLDQLVVDVYNSKDEGASLKLFIGEKIIESNDLVYKYFFKFRKKHEKKKKKIKLSEKEVEDKSKGETKLKSKDRNLKTKSSKKKEEYTPGVSNLSLSRLSQLLKDVDDVNLENNF